MSHADKDKRRAYLRDYRKAHPWKGSRKYYQLHKEQYRGYQRVRLAARRDWINELKSFQGCFVCGEGKHWRLVWHHLTSADRTGSIGYGHAPLEWVLSEMKRCVVVCRNCHEDIHTDWGRQVHGGGSVG